MDPLDPGHMKSAARIQFGIRASNRQSRTFATVTYFGHELLLSPGGVAMVVLAEGDGYLHAFSPGPAGK